MKTKNLILIATAVIVVIGILYFNQGGLNKVEITKVNTQKKYMIGEHFKGNVSSTPFVKMFEKVKNMKIDNNLQGDLGTVYYNSPEKTEGEIEAFFGVISSEKPETVDSLETIILPEGNYLQGSTNASSAFVNKTYNAIFEYAELNKITLLDQYIEWFPSENELVIQIKIKGE